jgi:Family of unknown function (DUF6325)
MADVSPAVPVELAVIEFPGSKFTGEVGRALADLIGREIVRIPDLVFVAKDPEGRLSSVQLMDLEEEHAAPFRDLEGEVNRLLSDADLQTAGDARTPGNSAVLVWENTWAREVAGAIQRSGGGLVAHDRLDAATVPRSKTEAPWDVIERTCQFNYAKKGP